MSDLNWQRLQELIQDYAAAFKQEHPIGLAELRSLIGDSPQQPTKAETSLQPYFVEPSQQQQPKRRLVYVEEYDGPSSD